MAELQLFRNEAQSARLPPICMQCGAPSTTEVFKKYTTDQVDVALPPPEPMGCFVLWPILGLLKLLSWSTATTMTVRTPLCDKHAHGWFTWSTLTAKTITDDLIVLAGVSDAFAAAWQEQRNAAQPRQQDVIKVRCRACQALNNENAKF